MLREPFPSLDVHMVAGKCRAPHCHPAQSGVTLWSLSCYWEILNRMSRRRCKPFYLSLAQGVGWESGGLEVLVCRLRSPPKRRNLYLSRLNVYFFSYSSNNRRYEDWRLRTVFHLHSLNIPSQSVHM